MKKDFGFGIVGCGMIAEVHADAIAHSSGGHLVSVCGRDPVKTRAFAGKHQAAAAGSLEDLVNDPAVDVVCVTTPSGGHLEPALAAAKAGKHLLVEKPLEISTERVEIMIQACREAGVLLAAVLQSRFGLGVRALKKAVEENRFGRLALCDAYVKWFRDQSYYDESEWKGTRRWDGGGALMNQGIHEIDLLIWVAGFPRQVTAMKGISAHREMEVEDTAVACLSFPNGAFGVIEGSTAAWPGEPRRLDIRGENGAAVLVDDRITQWEFREPREEDENIRKELGQESAYRSGSSDPRQMNNEGHYRQVQNLIDALRGEAPLAISGEEGARSVRLIEAIYRSAESGAAVRL